jgi:hypothetical protein
MSANVAAMESTFVLPDWQPMHHSHCNFFTALGQIVLMINQHPVEKMESEVK